MRTTAAEIKPEPAGTGIESRAMLVMLNLSVWRATRADSTATEEVAEKHGVKDGMGQYRKMLVDPKVLKPAHDRAWDAYHIHHKLTLPWQDGGFRILSSAGYFKYTEEMREAKDKFWSVVRNGFLPNYPEYVRQGKQLLGTLAEDADYPSVDRIEEKFGIRTVFAPMPSASDFRVQLGDAETARVKQDMAAWQRETLASAMRDPWARLQQVVAKMVERLNMFVETRDGKRHNSFRDTLVTNITDLLEIIPVLNVTGDPELERFRVRIASELTSFDGEQLRSDIKKRKETVRKAEEILEKMKAFV